jgi:nitrogen regulatory protein P-II 2
VKLIVAIIQPSKLDAVKQALAEEEVFRMTVIDAQGFGRQKGSTSLFRGDEIGVNLTRKVEIQLAVNDDFLERAVAAIIRGGRSGTRGRVGDGKIFVLPIDKCYRIRTGETDREAI